MPDKPFDDIIPQTRPGRWYLKMRIALTKSRLRFFKWLDAFFRKWALLLNKQIGDQTNDVEQIDAKVNKIVARWDALGLPGPPPDEGGFKTQDEPENQTENQQEQQENTTQQVFDNQQVASKNTLRQQQITTDEQPVDPLDTATAEKRLRPEDIAEQRLPNDLSPALKTATVLPLRKEQPKEAAQPKAVDTVKTGVEVNPVDQVATEHSTIEQELALQQRQQTQIDELVHAELLPEGSTLENTDPDELAEMMAKYEENKGR